MFRLRTGIPTEADREDENQAQAAQQDVTLGTDLILTLDHS